MLADSIDLNELNYLAEGNAHVVFALKKYKDCSGKVTDELVLRIPKSPANDIRNMSFVREREVFLKCVLGPCLGSQFLSLIKLNTVLKLDKPFIQCLIEKFHHKVPPRRLRQWQNYRSWSQFGYLQRNAHRPDRIVLEIKPKCGFIPTSPLVHPSRRMKFHCHRFGLYQELMSRGLIKKGWQQSDCKLHKSDYSPVFMFSGESEKIFTSLKALMKQPQNNFRVWNSEGVCVLGDGVITDQSQVEIILRKIMRENNFESIWEQLAFVSSKVLVREPLLQRLLNLQKLDVLDIDGILEVYDRFLSICGSCDFAENKLMFTKDCFKKSDENHVVPKPSCKYLDSLLQKVEESHKHHLHLSNNSEMLNLARSSCLEAISKLSESACVWLLQGWLISLSLCDASIMLSLGSFINGEERLQSSFDDGSVYLDGVECAVYTLNLIDCDPKPSLKLRGRRAKEDIFSLI